MDRCSRLTLRVGTGAGLSASLRPCAKPISCSAPDPGAFDDALELGEGRLEIMGPGGVEQGQIKTALDDGADRPPPPPDLVAAEIVVVELEAGPAGEVARLHSGDVELAGAGSDPVEALDHPAQFGRAHVGAEIGDLAVGLAALLDDALVVLERSDEGEAVEQGPVQGPVLLLLDLVGAARRLVPADGRGDRQ